MLFLDLASVGRVNLLVKEYLIRVLEAKTVTSDRVWREPPNARPRHQASLSLTRVLERCFILADERELPGYYFKRSW